MHKIPEVEEAKLLMIEAADKWSLWKWLTEKKRLRRTADTAVAALADAEKQVKAEWPDDLRKAYAEVAAEVEAEQDPAAKKKLDKARKDAANVDAKIKAAARRVYEADDEAERARLEAEDTFAEAEKRMSTDMARQGSRQAVASWEMRESAIRKAEIAARAGH
jgi:hypothetical protein